MSKIGLIWSPNSQLFTCGVTNHRVDGPSYTRLVHSVSYRLTWLNHDSLRYLMVDRKICCRRTRKCMYPIADSKWMYDACSPQRIWRSFITSGVQHDWKPSQLRFEFARLCPETQAYPWCPPSKIWQWTAFAELFHTSQRLPFVCGLILRQRPLPDWARVRIIHRSSAAHY